jgi:YVTN family beta-propeller protein
MRHLPTFPNGRQRTLLLAAVLMLLPALAATLAEPRGTRSRLTGHARAAYAQDAPAVGPRVYVGNWGGTTVSVLDPGQNHAEIARVLVGGNPLAFGLSPDRK